MPKGQTITGLVRSRASRSFCEKLVSAMPWMRRYAYTLTAGSLVDGDDLVQQALLQALEKHDQFSGENMDGWLIAILRNKWLNLCKRKDVASRYEGNEASVDTLAASPCQANSASHADNRSEEIHLLSLELRRYLGDLPVETQNILLLIYGFGWTYKEAADRLGWNVRTVHSRVTRARKILRARMTEQDLSRSGNGRDR